MLPRSSFGACVGVPADGKETSAVEHPLPDWIFEPRMVRSIAARLTADLSPGFDSISRAPPSSSPDRNSDRLATPDQSIGIFTAHGFTIIGQS